MTGRLLDEKPNIILMNHKFDWTRNEIEVFKRYFKAGIKMTDIADLMNEDEVDLMLLGVHLYEKGELTLR